MPALVRLLVAALCLWPMSAAAAQQQDTHRIQSDGECVEGECPIDLIRSYDGQPLLIYSDRVVRFTDAGAVSLSLRRSIKGLIYRSDGVPVWLSDDSLGVINDAGDMTPLVGLPIRPDGISVSDDDALYVYKSGATSTLIRISDNLDSLSTMRLPFRIHAVAHTQGRVLLASNGKIWSLGPEGLQVYFANDSLGAINSVSVVQQETVLLATNKGLLVTDLKGGEAEWLSVQPASKAIATSSAIYVLDRIKGKIKALPVRSGG